MAEEALQCFASLYEAVPGMISELDEVLRTARENQRQMLEENQHPAQMGTPKRRPSTSSSLKSRHSKHQPPPDPMVQDAMPTVTQEQLPNMTEADMLRLSQRKRKTASAASARGSGAHKYRSRSLVVIYYDGDVQKRFETIVRNIGICRNSLRKGKMNAKLDIMSRSSGSSGSEDSEHEVLRGIRRANGYTSKMWTTSALPRKGDAPVFDRADGFLDKAQTLCERAAHQVLRDGDCALEINSAKEHLASAQKITEAELPNLRKNADKAVEKRRISVTRRRDANAMESDSKDDETSTEKIDIDQRLGSPVQQLEVDTLEVDESDEDEYKVDIDGQDLTNCGIENMSAPILETLQLGKFRMRTTRRMNERLATMET